MASSSQLSKSSSSCVPARKTTYDVFLSFRGEDTRNNFVDHLYAALLQKGIHTFKDDQMLGGGKPISHSLLKAIKESKFAVVVFSKDYASSSWCLNELSEIMECHDQMGLKVLPVFYHLDPSDVRKQKGNFATAFQEHVLSRIREEDEVNKWKQALTAAANLSGYHISTVSGGESTTINKIVQAILGDMQPLGRETNLIGMQFHMDKLHSLLSIEETDEVRIIGIYGMGGIGKTTIARAIYKRIAYNFEGSSFVSNVRENTSSEKDICLLQEKILKDILAADQGFSIQDPEFGADMIRERFGNKKVFLVLDDVNDAKQLEFLAAEHEWFGPGSRIIITTRDEHLLSYANARYKPDLLRMEQALELFCRHAFKKNSPPEEFKGLSNRAISYTGRLPLAVKVLGSFFFGRDINLWKSALDRLKTPAKVFETLRLSYDGLEESDKKIFLDIVVFFKGEDVDYVTRVLDSFDFSVGLGLTVLIEKSLITVSKYRLDMHDLIEEMGWQVVSQSAPDSRLPTSKKIHDIIIENKKLELIEGIVDRRSLFEVINKKRRESRRGILSWWQHNVFHHKDCNANVFKLMKNLRLLYVKGNFICRKPTLIPHELRWLFWLDYPFSSLPVATMSKLVGLDMYRGKIKHLWKGQKIMQNLKFIQLEHMDNLSRFPNVSGAPNIERLTLILCENLVEVHESLGFLKRLVYLNMSVCEKLKRLPSRFEMESLETLVLFHCESLKRLPEFSPCMVKLSHLHVQGCYRLRELPCSIRNVFNLSILNLSSCNNLNNIPESICELKSLTTLNLENTHDLTNFPISISHYSCLKHVCLSDCKQLQVLPGLPLGIQVLEARNCISLEVIEDLSKEYEWLYKIDLCGCKKLLVDTQNERYLDKMLKQSFLKKWATMDGCLSIAIPGRKIPSWFEEQQNGSTITLKLPFKWQTEIIGFAICVVLSQVTWPFPSILFRFENGGMSVPKLEKYCFYRSVETFGDDKSENVWMSYVPLSLLENMHPIDDDDDDDDDCGCEDWSRMIEGNLTVGLHSVRGLRIGARIVYKEDVESTQQINKHSLTSSYYWNWKLRHHWWSRNTIVLRI